MRPAVQRTNLIDVVYNRISEMIMDGVIQPGELINRQDLAHNLGVSQTPVNESINRMQGEGLVIRSPGKGFFLKEYSIQDQADFYAARAGIESMAIRLCIERLSDGELQQLGRHYDEFRLPLTDAQKIHYRHQDHVFHEQTLLLSDNAVFRDFNSQYNFMAKCYLQGLLRPPEETLPEHQALCRALVARDTEKAVTLIISHHMATRATLLAKNQAH